MGSTGNGLDFLTWRKQWNDKYGIMPDYDVDDGSGTMENISPNQRHQLEKELDRFIEVFPEIKEQGGFTISLENNLKEDSWGAAYTFGFSEILITNKLFDKSLWNDEGSWYAGVFNTLHPKGTTGLSSISHELGHGIVDRIARKTVTSYEDFMSNYNQIIGNMEKDITDSAAKSIGSTHNNLAGYVSGYANQGRGETIAEAVSDYVANRDKANPYSIAIIKELKKRLKK